MQVLLECFYMYLTVNNGGEIETDRLWKTRLELNVLAIDLTFAFKGNTSIHLILEWTRIKSERCKFMVFWSLLISKTMET
jgi:hypothetical protein